MAKGKKTVRKTGKKQARKTEKTYRVVSEHDANDTFEVKAFDSEGAKDKALEALGWWVAKPE